MMIHIYSCDRCGAELVKTRFAVQLYCGEHDEPLGVMTAETPGLWLCGRCVRSFNALVGRWLDTAPGEAPAAGPPHPHFDHVHVGSPVR